MSLAVRDLRGQVVFVTGAASGIGAAGAAELQRRGALPVLVDQDAAGLAAQACALTASGAEQPLTFTCLPPRSGRRAALDLT